jgi:hypothetical protein
MSLRANQSARTTQTIVLFKMASIPTTEDLRYALTRAQSARKQVELPFRHPDTGLDFKIKVLAATTHRGPMWTLYKGEGDLAEQLWSKECCEVIIVQGQVRLYATSARDQPQLHSEDQPQETAAKSARFHL